jgi:hypothetical protein
MNRAVALAMFVAVMAGCLLVSCVNQEVEVVETYYETEYRTGYKTEQYTEMETVVVSTKQGKEYLDPVVKWQTGLYFWGSGAPLTYYYGYELEPTQHSKAKVKIEVNRPQLRLPGYIVAIDLSGPGQVPPKPEVAHGIFPSPSPEERRWFDSLVWLLAEERRFISGVRTAEDCAKYYPGDVGWWLGLKIPAAHTTISLLSDVTIPWADRVPCGNEIIEFDASGIYEFAIFANAWHTSPISSVTLVWQDEVTTQRPVTKERQVPYSEPYQVEKQRVVKQIKKVPFWEAIFGR